MASPIVIGERETTHVGLNHDYSVPGASMYGMDPGEAAAVKDGLPLADLVAILRDIEHEPPWRVLADQCVDYYDNKQLKSDILLLMQDRGIPPMIINIIQPTINTVLGMEAKNRRDWMVTFGDDGESEIIAKVVNKKMKSAERLSRADRSISQAYAAQVKAGLGWIEVGRNADPFRNPYRVNYVHRREIWWDWRYPEEDDWRYLLRRKWFDEDHLKQVLPKHLHPLLAVSCNGWTAPYFPGVHTMMNSEHTGLGDAYEREQAFPVADHEWRDTDRKRVVAFELWYRRWKNGLVFRLPNDKVMEFDQKNPRHMAAFTAGVISPFAAVFPQVRQSIWLGPHRIMDRKSPFPHRHFPYVPFFGFREDLSQAPYGLIRAMISPQDEINARRSRLNSLLGSRRAEVDRDALDTTYNTLEQFADDVSRADQVVVTNPDRKHKDGLKITDNSEMSVQQFQILAESKAEIHQVSGVFPAMSGDSRAGQSGLALNTLVEQGTVTLAEINDEYADSHRRVGELLMSLVVEDSKHPHEVTLGEGKAKTTVYVNKPSGFNQVGDMVRENDVSLAKIELELEEVPSTQTYRQQQFAQLAEITKALPPQVQQFVIDFVIESTDHPDRKKMAKRIRSALGIPEDGVDGEGVEDPAVTQVKQMAEEQIAALTQQLQAALAEAEKLRMDVEGKAADRDLKREEIEARRAAEAEKLDLDRRRLEADEATRAAEADRQFLDGLAADLDGDGKPDTDPKELLNSILDQIAPAMEKVAGQVDDVAESVDKVAETVGKSLDEVRKQVADLAAKVNQPPAKEDKPAVPMFAPGAIQVTVQNVPGKPVTKTVKLSDGTTATIEPRETQEDKE